MTLTLILILSVMTAFANSSERDSLEALAQDIVAKKQKISSIENRQRKLLKTLYKLNKEVERVNKSNGRKNSNLQSAQAEVKKVAYEINIQKEKIKKHKIDLSKKLKTLYQFQKLGPLHLILTAAKNGNLERNLIYLKSVSARDVGIINKYFTELNELENQENELKKRVKYYLLKKDSYDRNQKYLTQQKNLKLKLLQSLRINKNKSFKDIKSLKKQAKKLNIATNDEQFDNLFNSTFYENKGTMSAPVSGPVVNDYGLKFDYKYKLKFTQKGLTFAVDEKDPVKVIFSGKVVFNDFVDGYGHTAMVSHGDNYLSLYSNLSKNKLKIGTRLNKGDLIGYAISKGNNKNKLYFEIRHYSEPLNPNKWFATNFKTLAVK